MPAFYETPQIKAKKRKLRLELGLLMLKKKFFGPLSEADEQRRKEIMRELSIHY